MMSFQADLLKYSECAEHWIKQHLAIEEVPEKRLYEAMQYSLLAGGKRLRPVLSLAVCDMLDGDREKVLPFACAIELIHTYSLIHDDLPCMDNDDFRRGKPTNHKVFGEAMAVLAGDALLNRAFELMLAETLQQDGFSEGRAKAALIIARAAGSSGMIAGQVVDMESENRQIPYELLCYMHARKTGAIIKASILAPAELLKASDNVKASLSQYAEKIGLAFQIKDDILDIEGSASVIGKPVGSDEKNNKSTFVTVLGLKKAKELLKTSIEQAVEALKPLKHTDFLIKTAAYIAERDK
ncbi:MAG: polyprenyl synthetase family protein [Clostridia bacterium]|nr:polyprenyl synthetase family protein [Clostridia bacterium]